MLSDKKISLSKRVVKKMRAHMRWSWTDESSLPTFLSLSTLDATHLKPTTTTRSHSTQNPTTTMASSSTNGTTTTFYQTDKNLMKLCDFLRSSDGPAVREAIEMDKRVYYIKGTFMWRHTALLFSTRAIVVIERSSTFQSHRVYKTLTFMITTL